MTVVGSYRIYASNDKITCKMKYFEITIMITKLMVYRYNYEIVVAVIPIEVQAS